jgi:UDPglucose 6-dehydrogenase
MLYESAELAKISINMYLVSTVSVTNMIAEVCEKIGADWSEIAPALKLDRRIGPYAYLAPGLGISGGNLERDLATIGQIGRERGADVSLAYGFVGESRYRKDWALRTLFSEVLSRSERPTVAVWGLAYKQDTKSVKNSPSIQLLMKLRGIPIRAYDPQVVIREDVKEAAELAHVTQARTALEACDGASALVIMTPWAEFSKSSAGDVLSRLREKAVIDPFGILEKAVRDSGHECRYFRLGARC